MIVKGGFSAYGQSIGIIVFKGVTPRIPGDIGHAVTLDFPVCYEIIDGISFMNLVDGDERTAQILIEGAKRLEAKGVRAIAGDCGLLARYQQEIAAALSVPFFSSSLLLIPLVWRMQGQQGKIGVVTGHSGLLKEEHLRLAGVAPGTGIAIEGMENEPEFRKVVIEGHPVLDVDKMRQDLLAVTRRLVHNYSDVRSIVLECSNLPSFARDIQQETGLPVYDIVGLAKLVYSSVAPTQY
ncbi:MAG: aspartate/glutamate racemase family protein [Negativicutes bacterium]|nr:aspartate/glutamate racemase family protein [Negativicutes bacterium]